MITTLFLSTLFIAFAFMIIISKPNLLFVLFALEIILLGVNINFVLASLVLDDFLGKYITLILFSVAALDTSVGLILLLNYYGLHSVTHITTNIKG
jgi:NADH-quinone oxidoreductase subunit K